MLNPTFDIGFDQSSQVNLRCAWEVCRQGEQEELA